MALNDITMELPAGHMTNVFGQFDTYVKKIERQLHVTIICRDDQIRILGDQTRIQHAGQVISQLLAFSEKGNTITEQDVTYALSLVASHETATLSDIGEETICHTVNGRPIHPKTLGQKNYVGFLPGDLQSKVDPYLRPLYDALHQIMGADSFMKNMEKGLIEVAPLAYMRGRTLDNSFIILDEAQNTTPAQMKMFLTRIGFGSKVVVTGDATQKDLPPDTKSGLDVALKVLKNVEDIGFCELTSRDVVRHPLVQKIVNAYEDYEQKQSAGNRRRKQVAK